MMKEIEVGEAVFQADGNRITLDHGCSVVAGTKQALENIRTILSEKKKC